MLLWDLYNESSNNKLSTKSKPLLEAVFHWDQETTPSQSIRVGVWFDNPELNKVQIENTYIITFHSYHPPDHLVNQIKKLSKHGRPSICSEYIATGSTFQACLPIFKENKIICLTGGGAIIYEYSNHLLLRSEEDTSELEVWFHDIFSKPAHLTIVKRSS